MLVPAGYSTAFPECAKPKSRYPVRQDSSIDLRYSDIVLAAVATIVYYSTVPLSAGLEALLESCWET